MQQIDRDLSDGPSGRRLLRGPSSFVLYRWVIRCGIAASIAAFGLSILSLVRAPQSLVDVAVAALLATALPAIVLSCWSRLKDWAERQVGYTTLPTSHRELEQRDPYFGAAIRDAGQPYLRRQYFNSIVSDVKSRSK